MEKETYKMPQRKLIVIVYFFMVCNALGHNLDPSLSPKEKSCWIRAEAKVPTGVKPDLSREKRADYLGPWENVIKTFRKIIYANCCDTPEAWINEGLIVNKVRWIHQNNGSKHAERKEISVEDFKLNYSRIITPQIKKIIQRQEPKRIFENSQGCMIGNGEVWFQPDGSIVTVNSTISSSAS